MRTDTEGIVLRETKTSYNRRMILLFSKDYGKISAGTSLGERSKSKSLYQIFFAKSKNQINLKKKIEIFLSKK